MHQVFVGIIGCHSGFAGQLTGQQRDELTDANGEQPAKQVRLIHYQQAEIQDELLREHAVANVLSTPPIAAVRERANQLLRVSSAVALCHSARPRCLRAQSAVSRWNQTLHRSARPPASGIAPI
ncbi:MAG: hypothetical protein RL685_195 [Pseudomonadota bacterium]